MTAPWPAWLQWLAYGVVYGAGTCCIMSAVIAFKRARRRAEYVERWHTRSEL